MDSSFPKFDLDVQSRTGEKQSSDAEGDLQKPSAESDSITGPPEKKQKMDECESPSEVESSSANVGPCYFSILPNEILHMIFSHISSDRKRIRQVCKLWYEVSNSRQKPDECYIMDVWAIWNSSASFKHIDNCGFKYVDLCFKAGDVENFPVTTWEKVGTKIRSLEFRGCKLGDQIMERIILFSPNLQILRITLRFRLKIDPNVTLCSIEMLNKLNIAQNTLRTFEIGVSRGVENFRRHPGPLFCMFQNVEYKIWHEIFQGLLRVFPNVVHFGWTRIHERQDEFEEVFKCAFTRAEASTSDHEAVAAVMAHSLSTKAWIAAFNELAKVRLASISLSAHDDFSQSNWDQNSLINFFQNPNKLKSVMINLPGHVSPHFIITLILKILKNCHELEELEHLKDTLWLHHLTLDQENELSKLLTLSPKLEKVFMSQFTLGLKSHSLSHNPSWRNGLHLHVRSPILWGNYFFFKHYPDLQHLTLANKVSDSILQTVFQFLVNLKTLEFTLHYAVTNFGITGRLNGQITGYGIDRLQNLEALRIHGLHRLKCLEYEVDEGIFEDFRLPNLKYLSWVFPKKLCTMALIGALMPLLEYISFIIPYQGSFTTESLITLCRSSKNLQVLKFNGNILVAEVKQMVKLCPTLKSIICSDAKYHYNNFTKRVVRH